MIFNIQFGLFQYFDTEIDYKKKTDCVILLTSKAVMPCDFRSSLISSQAMPRSIPLITIFKGFSHCDGRSLDFNSSRDVFAGGCWRAALVLFPFLPLWLQRVALWARYRWPFYNGSDVPEHLVLERSVPFWKPDRFVQVAKHSLILDLEMRR
jgi:hypothetical protein